MSVEEIGGSLDVVTVEDDLQMLDVLFNFDVGSCSVQFEGAEAEDVGERRWFKVGVDEVLVKVVMEGWARFGKDY